MSIKKNTEEKLDINVNESKEESKTENKKEIKELSATEKAELYARKKEERLRAQNSREVLSIHESLTKPGKKYRLVNLNEKNIADRRADGWEIVKAPIHKGDGSLANAIGPSGGIEVSVSKRDPDAKAVWMETDEENYQILRDIEADKAKDQFLQIDQSEIPQESKIGHVNINLSR